MTTAKFYQSDINRSIEIFINGNKEIIFRTEKTEKNKHSEISIGLEPNDIEIMIKILTEMVKEIDAR